MSFTSNAHALYIICLCTGMPDLVDIFVAQHVLFQLNHEGPAHCYAYWLFFIISLLLISGPTAPQQTASMSHLEHSNSPVTKEVGITGGNYTTKRRRSKSNSRRIRQRQLDFQSIIPCKVNIQSLPEVFIRYLGINIPLVCAR